MTNPLVDELEKAFQHVRDKKVPLGERLAHIKDRVAELSPVFRDAVETFVGRLEQAGAGADAPMVGDPMPGFLLPDDNGRLTSLGELIDNAPVAIVFHRGHWCPYCRLNLVGLAEAQDAIQPVRLVAISAETQKYTREIKAESGASFPILTDIGCGYALSLGLAVWVDDAMSSLIAAAGWDVPEYQGQPGWILPIPSVFVVGQDGLIKSRHIDPDYRRRLEISDLIAAARAALRAPA
jgi:peroxiredoxin